MIARRAQATYWSLMALALLIGAGRTNTLGLTLGQAVAVTVLFLIGMAVLYLGWRFSRDP